ncbi:MAG: hypothetical protein GEU99_13050 [Luteitalea sp.]|nr:hypothetical protein [Luteitalea sp.]
MTDRRDATSRTSNAPVSPTVHPDYVRDRLDASAHADEHFSALLEQHASRLVGTGRCLATFRQSVEAFEKYQDTRTLARLEEAHNELCLLEELLAQTNPLFSTIEYEPVLPGCDKRIDFRATNDCVVWFIEVKTIHPELIDRWDQYERVVRSGRITENVTIHFERDRMGGQLWHQRFSARARMLEYSRELEDRITACGIDSPRHRFMLALFSDGFVCQKDELEDFVAFYRTGLHRPDDGLAKMEAHDVGSKNVTLTRRITRFAHFSRSPFAASPAEKDWNVRPPAMLV